MRRETRHVVVIPLLVWTGLMLLLGLTLSYAYLPLPAKLEAALVVSVAKTLLIALIFMQLREASALVRVTAFVGLAWACLLFLFSFADFLTR